MNLNVTLAIFWRNFVSYFINPTGYVFICLFVLMSAVAAFWPNEFFNNNLANLDQLHRAMPLILLVFIPAVTMGVWAEEKSEGTDEVLLTLPASDLDVVIGKYLAVVAIFTVSLLFSISNVFVLELLGDPDYGVIAANYFGYWLMGLTMLSVGMVASFVTSNLTVAFILGLVLNAPLVALSYSDVVIRDPNLARTLSDLSVGEQFSDFGRGVVTLSGTLYFFGIIGSMLYVCMVLIGRRNWVGATRSRAGEGNVVVENVVSGFVVFGLVASLVALGVSLGSQVWSGQGIASLTQSTILSYLLAFLAWGLVTAVAVWFLRQGGEHFFVRAASLIVAAVALMFLCTRFNVRADWSEEKLSSLSPRTLELLQSLRSNQGAVGEGTNTPTSFVGNATLVTTDGAYVGANLKFTSGPNKDQTRRVQGYDGKSRTFKFASGFPAPPTVGDTFAIDRPPIRIEAYISPEVPEEYVQTRLNLLNTLREFEAASGGRVNVVIHDTIQLSPEAKTAEEQYDITPRQVRSTNRGSIRVDRIYMGVAIVCGSERVRLPFIDRGTPVEYELVSAVTTVSQQRRKRLGLVKTDLQLTAGFDMSNFSQLPEEAVIVELRKQFDVVEIDFAPKDPDPNKDRELWAAELAGLDVLFAAQPSTLGPDQLDRFLAAMRSGIPTAIFEDPLPTQFNVPGTADERRAPNQGPMSMMMGRQPAPPKGDVTKLWIMLNVLFSDLDVVYQEYNPLPTLGDLPKELVFVAPASGNENAFNRRLSLTNKLQRVLFFFGGHINGRKTASARQVNATVGSGSGRDSIVGGESLNNSDDYYVGFDLKFTSGDLSGENRKIVGYDGATRTFVVDPPFARAPSEGDKFDVEEFLTFVPLAETNDLTGVTPISNLISRNPFTGEARMQPNPKRTKTEDVYTLAAWIHGPLDATKIVTAAPPIPAATERGRKQDELNVILAADIDVMSTGIFQTRDVGFQSDDPVKLDFDNVTFVLNILDHLAGESRFIDVRNRRPRHRTLTAIESFVRQRQNETLEEKQRFRDEVEKTLDATKKRMEDEEKKIESSISDPIAREQEKNRVAQANIVRLQKETEEQQRRAERQIENIERNEQLKIRELQAMYKLLAIGLPPIPPLLLGLLVFLWRRSREREGVPSKRLR